MNFKQGDKVKLLKRSGGSCLQINDVGTVIKANGDDINVLWDRTQIHVAPYWWWVKASDIKKLNQPNHPYTSIFK